MNESAKVFLNCILAAAVSVAAFLAMQYLDQLMWNMGWHPLYALVEPDETGYGPIYFVYDLIRLLIFGWLIAEFLLHLHPQRVALYTIVTFVAVFLLLKFYLGMYWGTIYLVLLNIAWLFAIPVLYLLLVRRERNKQA